MKPEQRQQQIMAQLRALQAELSVEELARKFAVSALTIRRDLERLEVDGAILRTHGGCVLRATVESAYHRKVALNFELKQAIGRAAAQEVKSGDAILINDGSTTFHLAPHLGNTGKLFVYTNSIAVISELSRFPDIRLYILGGEYIPARYFFGGSMMEQILEGFHFDTVFLGTDAVDANGNVYVGGSTYNGWLGPDGENPLNPCPEDSIFPFPAPPLTEPAPPLSAFVAAFDPDGAYRWHTFYGGPDGDDTVGAIRLDPAGDLRLAGTSEGSWQGPGGEAPLQDPHGVC